MCHLMIATSIPLASCATGHPEKADGCAISSKLLNLVHSMKERPTDHALPRSFTRRATSMSMSIMIRHAAVLSTRREANVNDELHFPDSSRESHRWNLLPPSSGVGRRPKIQYACTEVDLCGHHTTRRNSSTSQAKKGTTK
ncbi:hypothetical protein BJV78DRAFT_376304 [Lactifluus subvellereus]|nr:hypothetical protein BJV78DRAFT_376304 [Lactifluus subvellereus]